MGGTFWQGFMVGRRDGGDWKSIVERVIEGAEGLDVERDGDVVTVTLNRPEVMNAMTGFLFREFGRVFRELTADESVRAVILTGAGGNFCSGADVGEQSDRAGGAVVWSGW